MIDDLPIQWIWFRFRAGIYPIMHVCLSISSQLCFKNKRFYLWNHLNTIPTCVIITNLFWPPIFQYIINNHASGRIVVFRNFIKPDSNRPINYSWRFMLLSLLPSE